MTDTKTLREEYLQTKNLANMDLLGGSPATKYQREGAKNNAIKRLPETQTALLNAIMRDSVTVPVTEEVVDGGKLLELATGNENVFVVGFRNIDRLIAQTLYPKENAAGYPINAEFVSRLNSLLAGDVSYQIGAEYMPTVQPNANLYGVAKTRQHLTGKITMMLQDAYGTELNRIYLYKQVNEEALKRLNNDKVISIVTEVPLNLVKEIGKMTGRSVVLTSTLLPGAIKYEEEMTSADIRTAIAKAMSSTGKKTNVTKNVTKGS